MHVMGPSKTAYFCDRSSYFYEWFQMVPMKTLMHSITLKLNLNVGSYGIIIIMISEISELLEE